MHTIALYLKFVQRAIVCSLILKRFLHIIFCLAFINLNAQTNLVQNGSFEQVTCCPTSGSEIETNSNCVTGWFNPNYGSPDYFNQCSANYGVPDHFGEYQPAHSGIAYAGLFSFEGNISITSAEYIEHTLTHPLIAGRKYCVSFYICSSDKMQFGTDAIGAYFSTDTLQGSSQYFPVQPQIESPAGSPITDTMNWVHISGEFVASGGEQFITIGRFKSNVSTTFDTTGWGTDPRAYYYIDDVSVTYCDPTAFHAPPVLQKIDLPPASPPSPFRIPTFIGQGDVFVIDSLPAGSSLHLYNTFGQLVYANDNYDNSIRSWLFTQGIYCCSIQFPDGNTRAARVYFQR